MLDQLQPEILHVTVLHTNYSFAHGEQKNEVSLKAALLNCAQQIATSWGQNQAGHRSACRLQL